MNDLKSVSAVVQFILDHCEKARNSDNLLYMLVCESYARENGINFSGITAPEFLLYMTEFGFPPFETVRRARQRAFARGGA